MHETKMQTQANKEELERLCTSTWLNTSTHSGVGTRTLHAKPRTNQHS
jgi:hypothetical protein